MAMAALFVTVVAAAGWMTVRPASDADPVTPGSRAAIPSVRETDGCPVTVPPQPGFVPPEPHPHEPPALYDSVWYGSAGLWTMLYPAGEVWTDLPVGPDGKLGEKTIWWSTGYPTDHEPRPRSELTGRRLDAPGSAESGGPAGGGFRHDLGSFMLVGLEILPGCWELTATYRGAELSYVVLVKGPSTPSAAPYS